MADQEDVEGSGQAATGTTDAMRATRLREIRNDILSNLGRHALSIEGVASRHGISPGYVRQLFAAQGTTFSKFVLEQRLNAARAMLDNRRFADRSLAAAEQAYAAGQTDVSISQIAIFFALGGGWQRQPAKPAPNTAREADLR